ncbi:SlyX family protein [Endozoicomonas sp. 8E]|uniref:SlyX family protein n=1 Tax=Endozoicomonas sp. 8E TaxID=3035692 RepID=UPI0029391E5F|nr:SlyX family protein [Endozoicomonas sp. 8E]WOG26126.1 SlyX family protein [Endozoicomonas sp. 8E]
MSGVNEMNEELIELQTQLSFQEDTVAQLNEVVTRQQQEIDRLKQEMIQLKKQLMTMASSRLEEQKESAPPHY